MRTLTLTTLLALTLAACGGSSEPAAPAEPGAPTVAAAPANTEAPEPTDEPEAVGMTMALYEQIQDGMTQAEVEALLVGVRCEEMGSSEVMGIKSVILSCYASDGISNASLTFSNDALMSKAQINLK